MSRKNMVRIALVAAIAALVGAYYAFGLDRYFSLAYFKEQHAVFVAYYNANTLSTLLIYGLVYTIVTALSLPAASVMTLLAGALFGFWAGLVMVSVASTIGATLAFLAARLVFGEALQKKYPARFARINRNFEREGDLYLLTLRLVPIFPFFLVNLMMGLTKISTLRYFVISMVGMLPGTMAYVYAGLQLGQVDSLGDIVSPGLVAAFVIIGLLPLVMKRVSDLLRARKALNAYNAPSRFDYNVVVIGAGAAGLVASYIAAAVKAKVALVEKDRMGGDCLNTGCVPSKALIRTAKVLSYIRRHEDFGIKHASAELDFRDVMARVKDKIAAIEPHDSVERYTKLGVDCIEGAAMIEDPYRVRVGNRLLTTRSIIVAAGAAPLVPGIPGLEDVTHYTSDTLWEMEDLPKTLVVLGGGPIGCEMAQAFARLGSQVTQIELTDRLMTQEDEDVSAFVARKFAAEGIEVLTGHKAVEFRKTGGQQAVVCERDGETVEIGFDAVLLALGRRARVEGYGLDRLGVVVAEDGTIDHDDLLRTNFPNIYVCGDVAGPWQFTHTASHQAWYACVNALFSPVKTFAVDDRVIPWCTYTDPEVARVGLGEAQAKEQGIEVEVTRYDLGDLDRAIVEDEDAGFVKVLTQKGSDKVLGATIVGAHAGELVTEFILAMKHGIGLNKILGTIHIYPTYSEAGKYAAGNWKRAHAPEFALRLLRRFHAWRRGDAAKDGV